MVDSQSLKLAFALGEARDALLSHLANRLMGAGYDGATPATLAFLGQLECGVNYASEIARQLDVSRQMVSRTVQNLSRLGFLEMAEDPDRGNQKVITFTSLGEELMADARRILADLDQDFGHLFTAAEFSDLIGKLESIAAHLAEKRT